MVSYAIDPVGREYIAVLTIEQRSNNMVGLEVYDVIHAINGRNKKAARVTLRLRLVNLTELLLELV